MPAGLTSRWGWYWVGGFPDPGRAPKCKTQNLGLRSKEEKPRDPADATRKRVYCRLCKRVTLISWEAEHPEQQIGQAFYMQKKTYYQHITYGLQSDWLHVCKAILLVQTSRATCLQSDPIGTNFTGFCSNLKQFYWYKRRGLLFKLRRPLASQLSCGLLTGCILIGRLQVTQRGRGILPFHGKPKPKSWPPASPSPGSPT